MTYLPVMSAMILLVVGKDSDSSCQPSLFKLDQFSGQEATWKASHERAEPHARTKKF